LAVICFMLLFAGIGVASAEIIYVATDGTGDYNCDGVDDHIEINEATAYIDNLGGGTVHLKSGTYTINDSVILKSNMVFEGDEENYTIIKLKDQNNRDHWAHIYGSQVTNTILQNFRLDGNKAGQSGLSTGSRVQGIAFSYSDNIMVQYVTSINQTTDNFKFVHVTDSIIRNCTAKDSSHDGFYAGGCDGITFADNLAWHLGAHGVRFYNTKNSIVERNRLYSGDHGIDTNTEGGGWYGNNIYRNNYIDGSMFANYAAIVIESESSTTIENETIINNIIPTANSYGIYVWTRDTSQIKNIKITNNVINDCYHGIYRKDGEVIATNNIITNSKHYGIYGVVTSTYNDVWNNQDGNYGGGASAGTGDIFIDPLFADLENHDFHLKSTAGRWDAENEEWVIDTEDSPCICVGDPDDGCSNEPMPNGGRINMGAYGNTGEASKSAPTGPDTTPLYTTGHSPAKDATGVAKDMNMAVRIKDDGEGVDQSSIVMTVEGAQVTPAITGTKADYTITYTVLSTFYVIDILSFPNMTLAFLGISEVIHSFCILSL